MSEKFHLFFMLLTDMNVYLNSFIFILFFSPGSYNPFEQQTHDLIIVIGLYTEMDIFYNKRISLSWRINIK